jgi:large subunit ribosomal protein L15
VTSKLTIEVHGASKTAIAAVEKAGGTVKILAPTKEEVAEKNEKNKNKNKKKAS